MKRFFVLGLVILGFATLSSFGMGQNQVPYLSTKLSPYLKELGIVSSNINSDTYAKIETGIEDLQVYIGTGQQGNIPLYWCKIEIEEKLSGMKSNIFISMDIKGKDETLNICKDTIKYVFKPDETEMIKFEIIHHLSTNEIQYIWLDGNNNRNEKTIIIPLDPPLKKGKMFPDLTVKKLDGEKLSFKDLIGKTVVINWWSTRCGPCIAEMPGLNKLVEQYKQNPNVVFIAIADNREEDIIHFLETKEFNYIHTLKNEETVKIFGISWPVNVIVNPAGKISYYSRGGHPNIYRELDNILSVLLE